MTIDAKTKTFGSSDPALTGTLSGFLAADAVTASYSRAAGETVGVYPITATLSPSAVLSNYSITTTPANLTIEKYFFDVCDGADLCTGGSNNNSTGIGGRLTINATIPYLGSGTAAVTLSPASLAGKAALNPDTVNNTPERFKVWIVSNLKPARLFCSGPALRRRADP